MGIFSPPLAWKSSTRTRSFSNNTLKLFGATFTGSCASAVPAPRTTNKATTKTPTMMRAELFIVYFLSLLGLEGNPRGAYSRRPRQASADAPVHAAHFGMIWLFLHELGVNRVATSGAPGTVPKRPSDRRN